MSDEFENIKSVPTRLDLRELFPIELRTIFAKSFWFICATFLIAIAPFWLLDSNTMVNSAEIHTDIAAGVEAMQDSLKELFANLLWFSVLITCLKLAYEYLYRSMFTYSIELEHITITRGIFFRSRSSFPLARVNDVSLKRTPIQLLFLLYSVDVLTASPVSEFGNIEGLSKKNAVDLQTYLLAMVETTLPDVHEKAAAAAQTRSISPREVDQIIHAQSPPSNSMGVLLKP